MCFEEIVKRKWKNFKARNSGKKIRFDKLGNEILVKLSYREFFDLWEPFRDSPMFYTNFTAYSLVICRTGDIGHYEIGNVRVDTLSNNTLEGNSSRTPVEQQTVRDNAKRSALLTLTETSKTKRKETFRKTCHQQKERNSQFGTYWITNEHSNMKWHDAKGEVPLGYRKGRKL